MSRTKNLITNYEEFTGDRSGELPSLEDMLEYCFETGLGILGEEDDNE
jgi:hypothetical protein